jgi:hypothetical protein
MGPDAESLSCDRAHRIARGRLESRPYEDTGNGLNAFKMVSAKQINQLRGTPGLPVWQRNYYEHIVRNEAELERIRDYIRANPAKWDEDPENRPGMVYPRQTHSSR